MSEEYRPFKRRDEAELDQEEPESYRPSEGAQDRNAFDYDDPYVRDSSGRPVGFKRSESPAARRTRRRGYAEGPPIKPYLILSGIFAGLLLASGQTLYAGAVAAVTFLVYLVSRWAR